MSDTPEVLRYSAFAATPEGGNPAGVVLDASGLDDAAMQRIAAEVGYSETAFIVGGVGGTRDREGGRSGGGATNVTFGESPTGADMPGTADIDTSASVGVLDASVLGEDDDAPRYRVRYWSPAAEVPFCGHATVATAVALAERGGPSEMVFDTNGGEVTLRAATDAAGGITVSFTSVGPQLRPLDPEIAGRLLALLGLEPDDVDPRYPLGEAFAGNWHPILFLSDPELFHQFRFSPSEVASLMREQGWFGTVTVLHQTEPAGFEARNLFPVGRITEDPATGSAAASTGAYLREHGFAEKTIRISQGRHVGRPSELVVHIPATGGIEVSGGATRIA